MQIIVNISEFFPPLYARGQCNNNNGEEQQHRDREGEKEWETQAKSTKLTAKANCCAFNQKFYSLASLSGRKVIPIGERLGTSHSPALFAACAHTLHSPHSHSTLPRARTRTPHSLAPSTYLHAHAGTRSHTHTLSRTLSTATSFDYGFVCLPSVGQSILFFFRSPLISVLKIALRCTLRWRSANTHSQLQAHTCTHAYRDKKKYKETKTAATTSQSIINLLCT